MPADRRIIVGPRRVSTRRSLQDRRVQNYNEAFDLHPNGTTYRRLGRRRGDDINYPPCATIVASPSSLSTVVGQTPSAVVVASGLDALANPLAGLAYAATSSNTGVATVTVLGATVTVTFVGAGTATITITSDQAQTTVAVTVTAAVANATQLLFVTAPGGAVAGSVLTTQPVLQLADVNGAAVATSGVSVVASLQTGSGALSGTTTKTTDGSGRATFTDLQLSVAGVVSLQFASTGLASANATVTVGPASSPTHWYDPLIGMTTGLAVNPGNVSSSQQRIDWATLIDGVQASYYSWGFSNGGAFGAPSNTGWWADFNFASGGSLMYYEGAVNRWMYSIMKGEGSGGTIKGEADAMARNYRDHVTAALAAGPSGYPQLLAWFPESLLGLVLLYNDTAALNVLLGLEGKFIQLSGYYPDGQCKNTEFATDPTLPSPLKGFEGRLMARLCIGALCCYKASPTAKPPKIAIGVYAKQYATWLDVAVAYCDNYLTQIRPTGEINMGGNTANPQNSWNGGQGNFHAALVADAYWKVYQVTGTAAYLTAMTKIAGFLKSKQYSRLTPYTGNYPNTGDGMIYESRSSVGFTATTLGNAFDVTQAGSPLGQANLGGFFASLFARTGDTAFAQQLIGTTSANAYGTAQAKYGLLGTHFDPINVGNNPATQEKSLNEALGGVTGIYEALA